MYCGEQDAASNSTNMPGCKQQGDGSAQTHAWLNVSEQCHVAMKAAENPAWDARTRCAGLPHVQLSAR